MSGWDRSIDGLGFHTDSAELFFVSDEELADGSLEVGAPIEFDPERQAVLDELHERLSELWSEGGLVYELYDVEAADDADCGAADMLAALWDIADNGDLPTEIAGCSIAYLMDGGVWEEDLQQLGDALYLALAGGGAGGEAIDFDEAAELTNAYLDSLLGGGSSEDLHLFGLDPGFTCWFCGEDWDLAYAIVNLAEGWMALLLATDAA
jgi:hypothetical protein